MSRKTKKPNFLDDMFGWPMSLGDIVNFPDEITGEFLPAKIVKLKEYEVIEDEFSCIGELEVITLNDNGEEDSNSKRVEVFSEVCMLAFGHPDNEKVWKRQEFNENKEKLLKSFRERHGISE